MKHKSILQVFIWVCISLTLCACSERKTLIGISQCCGGLWRDKVNKEIQLGLYQYKNAEAIFTSANSDGLMQARQIDSLVNQRVDLLVVAPQDVQSVVPAVERAYRKGIPVILYDRKINSSSYTAYIGGDNEEAGREVARFLAEKLQGKGTVVEITGSKDNTPMEERHDGFMKVMGKYPSIKVVTLQGNWRPEKSKVLMEQYLASGQQVDAVFGHSDYCVSGVLEPLKAMGLDKKVLVAGIDGLPGEDQGVDCVKKGKFAASYVYPTKGEEVVALAMRILNGKPYKKDNILRSFLATSQNCDAIALQYQELEAKVMDMDNISNNLLSYTRISRLQQWAILVAWTIALLSLFAAFYIYKVYRKKLQERKEVAHEFLESKDGWTAELIQLDESERYFIDRFKKKVIERMGDADLKMDDLGAEMHLSKVQLYRRVKSLTGKTPAELLREMRLQKAHMLLQKTDKTISEVATEVGFAASGYFSSCFKKKYGVNPTELRVSV